MDKLTSKSCSFACSFFEERINHSFWHETRKTSEIVTLCATRIFSGDRPNIWRMSCPSSVKCAVKNRRPVIMSATPTLRPIVSSILTCSGCVISFPMVKYARLPYVPVASVPARSPSLSCARRTKRFCFGPAQKPPLRISGRFLYFWKYVLQ